MKKIIVLAILSLFFSCKKNSDQNTKTTKIVSSNYKCVPQVTDAEWYKKDNIAPLLDGYNVIDYPITTTNATLTKAWHWPMLLTMLKQPDLFTMLPN